MRFRGFVRFVLLMMVAGFGLLTAADALFAQERPRTFEGVEDSRIPNLPYYSYGRGLGLTTPDSTYQLNIRFRMQNRVTYQTADNQDDRIEAEVRRLRLRFDGFVGDPRFLYAIQLSFAPGDVGSVQPGENINIIRDAVFFYKATDRLNFGFGQTKLPGNRQRVNSSGALQLTDRSINNATFNIDRDFGVFANYTQTPRDSFGFAVRGAISTGDGRNVTGKSNHELAYTGRAELYPLGAFANNGSLFEGDLAREESFRLLLGATWHYNAGATRSRGQTGSETIYKQDLEVIHLDTMLKYRGWAFMASWMSRFADEPLRMPDGQGFNPSLFETGTGFDFQTSYLLPADYEIVARFSRQTPDSELRLLMPDRNQYSIGLTRYIWEHALKLQGELTWDRFFRHNDDNTGAMYARFQIEIGI